jgi:polar amino acid transport system substrate-binding protein
MQKKLPILFLLILMLALTACGGGTDAGPAGGEAGVPLKDFGGREVTIAVDNAYPPFSFINQAGDWIGFDYDVWDEVCKRLNCTPNYVEAAWDGLFEAMSVGEYDMTINGITLTLARSLIVDYGDPYVDYGQAILIRADDTRYPDEAAWVASDANVGTQLGTTNEAAAIKFVGEERVMSFEEYDMPVVALLAGDVDTVIIDEMAAVGFMGENPGEMVVAFNVTSGEMLAPVFPPLSDMTTSVNWAMQEMFSDGTMDSICETWFFRPCTPE